MNMNRGGRNNGWRINTLLKCLIKYVTICEVDSTRVRIIGANILPLYVGVMTKSYEFLG